MNENESLNQIVAELELFACYKCLNDTNGRAYNRSERVQEALCKTCFLHKAEDYMKEIGFDPLLDFDEASAREHFNPRD